MITGTTMYKPTEVSNVAHGTVILDTPSSSATSGANANTMIKSLSATCDSVKYGSPPVNRLQTNTIAVQGAAASRIRPATYESNCAAGRYGANQWRMNNQPSKAIENGLTAQLMNSVTPMPRT